MMFDPSNMQVIANSALVVAVPNMTASSSSVPAVNNVETNKTEAFVEGSLLSSDPRVQVDELDRWDAGKNGRFNVLARKEALGQLSIEELYELEKLTRLRRLENYPRSADEILWQRKQQKLTHSLILALKEYVEFHEAPRSS